MGNPPRNKETAAAYIGLGGHHVDRDELKNRFADAMHGKGATTDRQRRDG